MSVSTKLAEIEIAVKELTREEQLALASKLLEMVRFEGFGKPATDLSQFRGTVNFGVDGVEYQRKIRNEWERDL